MSLPPAAEPEHLTDVLRSAGVLRNGRVSDVTVELSTPTVLSHIYRLRLAYEGEARDAPASLFLKAKHLERPIGPWKYGHREVVFYRSVAPATPPGLLPRCYDTRWDEATGNWHLLLEDLKETHGSPTQWPLPPPLGDCETIVRTLARFHAMWWDDSRLGTSIGSWIDPADGGSSQKRLAEQVAHFADALGERLSAERRSLYDRLIDAMEPLTARYHSHRNMTIVHGDAHAWNCFLPRSAGTGTARLFDWDTWRPDFGSDDLAYLMALHWYPDLRRRRERHLLDIYHDELLARGVTGYDRRALQDDYRLSVLWSITTPVWQHAGNIPPVIWWPHLERIHLAAGDLGCHDLLG